MAEDRRGPGANQLEDEGVALLLRRRVEPRRQRTGRRRRPPRHPDQAGEQRRERTGAGGGPQGGGVERDRQQLGRVERDGAVEEGEALLLAEPGDPGAGDPGTVGLAEARRHPPLALPGPPTQRARRQPGGAALVGEGVEEGVGGGVVALAGAGQGGDDGGEEDEVREVEPGGQLVQVPGGAGLGRHHRPQPLPIECLDRAVVEHPGAVEDGAERVLRRDRLEHRRQRLAIADVAGGDLNRGAERLQLPAQLGGPDGLRTAAARQQQVAGTVLGDEVAGEQGAEAAGGAGEEDGGLGVEGAPRPGLGVGPNEPRHPRLALAQRHLMLALDRQRRRPDSERGVGAVAVEQEEAVGVLGLSGTNQAPNCGGGRVGRLPVPDHDRAAGEKSETLFSRDRGLQALQHPGTEIFRGGGRAEARVGDALDDLDLALGAAVHRDRRPLDRVERVEAAVRGGCPELVGADGTQRQRLDRDDRRPAVVGEQQRDRPVGRRGDASPQRAHGGAEQAHPAPGEGDPRVGSGPGQRRRLQRRVKQRRVDAEARGLRAPLRRQLDRREQLLAAAPGRGDGLEGRPVFEAQLGRPGVEVIDRDRLGARRRPLAQLPHRVGARGAQRAGRVARPRLGLLIGPGLGPRVDLQPGPAGGIESAGLDLDLDRTVLGQRQRRLDRQLLDRLGADLCTGPQRQLGEGGPRQDRGAMDGVVGEPGVGPQGDPAAEQHLLLAGHRGRRAEQGMFRGLQPGHADVAHARPPVEPEASALEGVSREVDALGRVRGEEGAPVDASAVAVGGGQCADQRLGVLASLAQQGGQSGVSLAERAPSHRAEDAVGAELQVGVDALLFEVLNPVLEAHRLPDLAGPVGR